MNIPAELEKKINEVITHYPVSKRSASLPLLHLFQEHFGYISEEAIPWIATKLELKPINILELVTFYPMFRRKPAGKCHIRVCRTLSCAMAGGYQLMDNMCEIAGIHRDGSHASTSPSAAIPSDDHLRHASEHLAHASEHLAHASEHLAHASEHGSPITVSSDGRYSIEFVECLASCGTGPVCMVDDDFYENVSDKTKAEKILKKYSTPL